MTFATLFLYFFFYSVIGWIYESILCSVEEHKPVNRGFLTGPYCPVYGFGGLFSALIFYGRTDNVVVLFFAGALLTGAVEYLTAVVLEKLFSAKWWDYSNYRFNIQGRVCLLGVTVFALLIILQIYVLHPTLLRVLSHFSNIAIEITAGILFFIMFTDTAYTVIHLLRLNNRLAEIQKNIDAFREKYTERKDALLNTLTAKFEETEFFNDHVKRLIAVHRFQNHRLARAFPKLTHTKHNDAWQKLRSFALPNKRER